MAWHSSPHIGVPWACRGLRLSPRKHEPWAPEAKEAWTSARGSLGFTSLHLPARRLRQATRPAEDLDSARSAHAMKRDPWDSSPHISVPLRFHGVNPVTPENWSGDQQTLMFFENRRMLEAEEEQRNVAVMKIDVRELYEDEADG